MTRHQTQARATAIHKESTRRTEQHFNTMRQYWHGVISVNPAAYKAAWCRWFHLYRREVIEL